ncbi:MAG: DUF3596 domain-containing protein [Comamonadaceae bacterium]|nr:DUF3596 domain-containing protein [Comamonadaceae bacterium]
MKDGWKMGRKATGYVEALPASVRLCFHYEGKSRREIIPDLPPTPAKNIRYAEQLLAKINQEISNGLFNYSEHFPKSRYVQDQQKAAGSTQKTGTLGYYLDLFLTSSTGLATATKSQYTNAAKIWRKQLGDDTSLKKLLPSRVSTTVAGYPWASNRMFNNTLIPLRGALKMALLDDKTLPNWLEGVDFRKRTDAKPDPLSTSEMHSVLDWVRENKDLRAWSYFAFAFATGLRPEEIIALRWSDVDRSRMKIHVTRAKTFKGEIKDTKTGDQRWVDLGPLAVQALDSVHPWTQAKDEIFENPYTDRSWYSSKAPHIRIWLPAIKASGISRRRAYCTRHTFATLLLQAGARVAYVSNQMGHTTPSQVEKTYSKWLPDADGGHARKMLAEAFKTR